ncbi:hypothetical protein COLO4_38143 [Corchorus olitorius]|uniref:Uncharacterized protein n=1 Tax=Corchorus olitorius TaxID=93759 RepID=A0A1R3FWW4_9ROSI|nr:hypothetical protein COLO4_38143 [Corchorus olitorius]
MANGSMAICSGGANLLQWKNSTSHSSGHGPF